MSPLRWTRLSTRNLAGALTKAGHPVSDRTVARLPREQGYSLQGNAKVAEGAQHGDRDAQFRYIAARPASSSTPGTRRVGGCQEEGEVGNFANGGAEWRPQGRPERVNVHDFPSDAVGKAIPYGIYDLGANTGWVWVGTDHDTSAFAAATLRRWWRAGGSPLSRRAAAADLRRLRRVQRRPGPGLEGGAGQAGRRDRAGGHLLPLPAGHLQVEQGGAPAVRADHPQLAGPLLTSHQAVVELISATTTTTGLTVHAELDTSEYPTGLRYTSKQVAALPIGKHDFHPDWNYTVRPEPHEYTRTVTEADEQPPVKHQLFLRCCLAGR